MAHVVDSKTVLVWGASLSSATPLFKYTGQGGVVGGGLAAELRTFVKDWLNRPQAATGTVAAFSEECETYNHHPANAGLYEPFHLASAGAVVLILPGGAALGVNTWELTLLCEEDARSGRSEHLDKAIFVCPKSLWDFLITFFQSGLDDPMKHASSLVELGPANSFLARWISRAACRSFIRSSRPVPKAPPFRMAVYPDNSSWDPNSPQGHLIRSDLLADLQHELESVL